MAKKKSMLSGLDDLFSDNSVDYDDKKSDGGIKSVRISLVEPNKSQPRTDFDQNALNDLASSIEKHGVLQPVLVRPLDNGGYQIIAGERRWRASRIAGLTEIPCIIREFSDKETMQIALIENLQRENLNPLEEAMGYQNLIDEYAMTQAELAQVMGKSRSVITNYLRVLALENSAKELLKSGGISMGHAKILCAMEAELQKTLAQKIADEDMSVRELEQYAKKLAEKRNNKKTPHDVTRNTFYREAEISLANAISRKVKVNHKKNGSVTVEVTLENDKDLTNFLSNFNN